MKKEELFYYRRKTKVSFEARRDLLAVSLQPDLSDEQDEELLRFCSQLNLKPAKVGAPITEDNVRVFHFPSGASDQDKAKIEKSLSKHRLVKRMGPITHFSDQSVTFMTNELVIKFKEQISSSKLDEIAERLSLKVIRTLPYAQNTYVLRAETLASYDLLEDINELAKTDSVEYAEPNLVTTAINDFTPNDFLFADQPHHQVINTEDAWDTTQGNNDIIIAVVDSGCDIDHPDFANPSASSWDKVYEPFDFANMDSDPINTGRNGEHGTKSCGIATANADNNEGVAGVAPGCRLMPIRRYSRGSDTEYADMYVWIAGFDPESRDPDFPDRISFGADVISNSFGLQQDAISGVMQDALDYITDHGRDGRGCVVVFSVGNDNDDFTVLHNPGAADEHGGRQWAAYERTIAVASSTISPPDAAEVKASSSSFGSALDVCAPGGGPRGTGERRTMSTDNVDGGDTAGSASATTNDYSDFGQTSCACPQVAGTAALMLSVNPGLTWQEVRQIIRDTAEHIDLDNTDPDGQWIDTDGDGEVDFSQWYGFGRVNAHRAVSRARDELPPLAPFTIWDIEAIVAAQEIIYMRRILATMKRFIDECPTPPRPPFDRVSIPIKLVQTEMNKLEELKTLRAKYIIDMHVDQEFLRAVAAICRENASLADSLVNK